MIGCYLDTVVNRSAFAKLGTPPTVKVALDGNSTSTWNRHQLHACRVLVAANAEFLLPVIGSNQQADKNGNRISKDMSDPFWEDYPEARHVLRRLVNRLDPDPLPSELAYLRRDRETGLFWAMLDLVTESSPPPSAATHDHRASSPIINVNRLSPLPSSPPSISRLNQRAPSTSPIIDVRNPALTLVNDVDLDSSPPRGPATSPLPDLYSDHEQNMAHDQQQPHLPAAPRPRRWQQQAHPPAPPPQTPPRPRRQTTIRNPPKYAPSSRPTSSPPNIQSSQHSDYVPSNEFSATPRATEDLTVALHSEFIRLVLLWAPPQTLFWSPSRPGLDLPNHVIDFDVQKRSLTTKIHDLSFVSVDDGGLWIREFGHDRGAGRTPLEAKRGLGVVVEGRPVFDDARLGQLVGEALAVYFEEKGIRDKILIIAAAQSYVRFFEVTITEAYVSELTRNAADGEAPFQEHLHLTATPWFDLRYPDHRVWAMRNLSGIVTLTDAWVY